MDALERTQHLRGHRPCRGRGLRAAARLGRIWLGATALLFLSACAGAAEEAPAPLRLAEIAPAVRAEIAQGHVPGAVVVVGDGGRVVYRAAFGWKSTGAGRQPLRADDIFDLASLTKVVATATAAMQLVEQGRLELDHPVADYWPAFAANGKAAVTVRQLLTHTSGLPPDLDLSTAWSGEAAGLARAAEVRPAHAPGARFVYSDVNFIALGALVERLTGEPLESYARRQIFEPLGMVDTGFRPSREALPRVVATDRQEGMLRWGDVQDPTAHRMGGVAGHAGLFSTADDLARFAQMLIGRGELDDARVLGARTVALMTSPGAVPGGFRRGLGWDIASPYSAAFDASYGPDGFGHTGYTGCSLWIDPKSGRFLIILTSRLDPDGHGDAKALRVSLAQLVGPAAAPAVVRISGPAR